MKSIKSFFNYKKQLYVLYNILDSVICLLFVVCLFLFTGMFPLIMAHVFDVKIEIFSNVELLPLTFYLFLSLFFYAFILLLLSYKIQATYNKADLIFKHILKEKVYICGKISGLPQKEVQKKFGKASLLISGLGGSPVNPLDHMISDYTYDELCNNSKAYEEQMKVCLDLLGNCTTIFLLSDWTDSKGAKREVDFALSKGITVITMQEKKMIEYRLKTHNYAKNNV